MRSIGYMTTIKSVYSKLAEYTRTLEISDHAGGKNLVVHAGPTKLGVTVSTAELAAALGLVTREEFDKAVERAVNARGQYWIAAHDHQRIVSEFAGGATKAEADELRERLAEANRLARQRHEANSAIIAQLNEAEATIARIKARVDASTSGWLKRELQACIDPKPAFTLPTKAGARFEAKSGDHYVGFKTVLFETTDRCIYTCDLNDWAYTPDEIRDMFTDHRLIKPQP